LQWGKKIQYRGDQNYFRFFYMSKNIVNFKIMLFGVNTFIDTDF
jgi:hypothetical protein